MPFVDTNDDVFLGEKSFATRHEALDHYETLSFDGDVLLHHPLRFLFPKS